MRPGAPSKRPLRQIKPFISHINPTSFQDTQSLFFSFHSDRYYQRGWKSANAFSKFSCFSQVTACSRGEVGQDRMSSTSTVILSHTTSLTSTVHQFCWSLLKISPFLRTPKPSCSSPPWIKAELLTEKGVY